MKTSSLVIALSLIGAPLSALAVCAPLDPPNVCANRLAREAQQDRWYARQQSIEENQAADRLAAALAISDEDVRNFPAKDVDASCSFDFHTQALLNACIDHAQPYYDIGELLWNAVSLTGRKECLLMARKYSKAYQFYVSLGSCLQVKKTEADMQRPHKFNAW